MISTLQKNLKHDNNAVLPCLLPSMHSTSCFNAEEIYKQNKIKVQLCDKFKKIVRDDRCHVTPKNLYLLKSEIADILWYLTAITNELGSSLSEIMDISLDKIQDRINRDQLQGSGDER